MTNPIKGEVSLKGPNGETFVLVFGFESLVLVEDKRGKAFGDVVEELDAGRLGALGALFWAGLRKHHPQISFEEAGQIALAIDSEELQAKIVEAITLAFPRKQEVGASAPRPPEAEQAA